MKKPLILCLAVLLTIPAFAVTDGTEDSLSSAKNQTIDALTKLKEMKPASTNKYSAEGLYVEQGTPYSSYGNSGLSSGYYKTASESPYTKTKIAEGLADMALMSAYSIGTSEQNKALSDMQAVSKDLAGSGVPEYEQMAKMMQAEITCIEQGDQICAQTEAEKLGNYVDSVMPKIDPNYRPSASEQAALSPFSKFIEAFASKVLVKLGDFALQSLLKALKLVTGPVGVLGELISALGSSLLENITDPSAAGDSFGDKAGDAFTTKAGSAFDSASGTKEFSGSSSEPAANPDLNKNSGGSVDAVKATKEKSIVK